MKKNNWERAYLLLKPAVLLALAVFVCFFLYQYDNKYTAPGPKGAKGVLVLDEAALERYPVLFLTEGWEYYGGQLLNPEDFVTSAPLPDEYIYIGQYGGFEAGDLSASPHGSASYRLTIQVPNELRSYLLELPEIFSAYRAYVNGNLVQAMGDPDPGSYRPATGNSRIKITAAGQIDILISVSDFSHIYSGMVYPPAFGEPEAVTSLLSTRLIFRSIFVAFALAIGALALLVGMVSRKNTLAVLYGLLCLFFIGYTSYPIFKTLMRGFYPFYTVENVSFSAMLAAVMLLQKNITGHSSKWSRIFIGFGLFTCLASVLLPLALTSGSLFVMGAYSYLIMAYEWLTALYLTATFACTLWKSGGYSTAMLGGILVFDTALIMDRVIPLYEPVVSGWFPELASFVLVLSIGVAVAQEVAAKYKDSAILEERASSMERLAEMQRVNYDLLRQRIDETKTVQHDLRHHAVMIESFLQNCEYDNLGTYIREFQAATQRVQPVEYSGHPVVNVLAQHYAQLAEKHGVSLTFKLEISRNIKVSEADLCAVLSNLLENGLEACRRQESGKRFIALAIGQKPSMLSIRMENSTDGKLSESDGAFFSSKAEGRKGYGLDSIRALAKRYAGDAEFRHDKDREVFVSTVLLTF